ncbi:alpha/beta fold hydrolase [Streptomyces sp. NPDC002143]
MTANLLKTSRRVCGLALLLPAAALIPPAPAAASTADGGSGTGGGKPTIVLVHGAWADASGWNQVIKTLQGDGYTVVAPANPLRGLTGDAAYLAAFLKSIKGPIVLVGHSYGGAVITNAATGNGNVKSLVYIAGFAPDTGETTGELIAKYPGSHLTDDPSAPVPTALNAVPIPPANGGIDFYIKPDKFSDVFLSDRLDATTAAALAASQRPATPATNTERSKTPAWRTIPSWYLVASDDRTIGTANERFMAKRAGARTVEVDAPHAAFLTAPDAVTDIIRDAARARSPRLADTGRSGSIGVMAGTAGLALATGTVLITVSRRRRAANG